MNLSSLLLPFLLLPACRPAEDSDSEGSLNGKDIGEEAGSTCLYHPLQHHISAQSARQHIPYCSFLRCHSWVLLWLWLNGWDRCRLKCVFSARCSSSPRHAKKNPPEAIHWRDLFAPPHLTWSTDVFAAQLAAPGCSYRLDVTVLLWVYCAWKHYHSHFEQDVISHIWLHHTDRLSIYTDTGLYICYGISLWCYRSLQHAEGKKRLYFVELCTHIIPNVSVLYRNPMRQVRGKKWLSIF